MSRECSQSVIKMLGHFRDTLGTGTLLGHLLDTSGPEGPRRHPLGHSLRHPHFAGTLCQTLHFGPFRPEDSCRGQECLDPREFASPTFVGLRKVIKGTEPTCKVSCAFCEIERCETERKREREREIQRQTDGRTDRQTDRQRERERQRHRKTERERERERERGR